MSAKAHRPTGIRRLTANALRRRRFHHHPTGRRLVDVIDSPWWDWGHKLMALVGQNEGGNWSEPTPPTWWYRLGTPTRMARTGYPRHPLSTFEVITDYTAFTERTEGLNEDGMYEWQAFCVNSDDELILGHRYWGGNFYGLRKHEAALLRRYLRRWHAIDWWGLRSWLYAQGLHAAVHRKRPGACNATPGPGQGGYDHWHCGLKRRHVGLHRTGNYVWGEVGGEPIGASYHPDEVPA